MEFSFIFSYPCMVEKIIFWSQILEVDILMDLHILRYLEHENHILSSWSLSLYMCVCVCVCLSDTRISQKQIIAELKKWCSMSVL